MWYDTAVPTILRSGPYRLYFFSPVGGRGRHAKPYQVKQARGVIVNYRLAGGNDEK